MHIFFLFSIQMYYMEPNLPLFGLQIALFWKSHLGLTSTYIICIMFNIYIYLHPLIQFLTPSWSLTTKSKGWRCGYKTSPLGWSPINGQQKHGQLEVVSLLSRVSAPSLKLVMGAHFDTVDGKNRIRNPKQPPNKLWDTYMYLLYYQLVSWPDFWSINSKDFLSSSVTKNSLRKPEEPGLAKLVKARGGLVTMGKINPKKLRGSKCLKVM